MDRYTLDFTGGEKNQLRFWGHLIPTEFKGESNQTCPAAAIQDIQVNSVASISQTSSCSSSRRYRKVLIKTLLNVFDLRQKWFPFNIWSHLIALKGGGKSGTWQMAGTGAPSLCNRTGRRSEMKKPFGEKGKSLQQKPQQVLDVMLCFLLHFLGFPPPQGRMSPW